MYDVAFLITNTYKNDKYGVQQKAQNERQVCVEVVSIGGKEFFNASLTGIKADIKLIMFAYDYNSETEVKYNNKIYKIYRTYQVDDNIELYLTERSGL